MGIVVHAFNPTTWEARGAWLCDFKACLVYIQSSRTARPRKRETLSQNKTGGAGEST